MPDVEPRLEFSIRDQFAPVVRQQGFKGSGRNFRRVIGDLIHVVNFQGSRYGGQFAVNLGIQPTRIPDVLGNEPSVRTITESLCEFRRRLAPSDGDKWWSYEKSQVSMDRAVADATTDFMRHGAPLFERMSGPDSPIYSVRPEDYDVGDFRFCGFGSTKVRMALVLMRLRLADARLDDARAFAQIGLENLGAASGLRRDFEEVLER